MLRLAAAGLLWTAGGYGASAASTHTFGRDIQPLLAKHCLLCHGPNEAEAGLRLDVDREAYAERESGERAIVPGKPEASELMRRITTDDDSERMPPDGEGERLSANEIAILREWIKAGGKYGAHWAYRPLDTAEPPSLKDESWVRNPIDRFVLARLKEKGIAPSPEADRPTLIKRLYYDLVGLPPTIEEVDAFVADNSLDAYSQLVRRLLASKHFGERWGRHWLDKARYADSDGYEKDRPRPNAWRYRDWVINAVNADMPMDQFTIEQLAGDLLPDATDSQRLATAFHRQTLTNTEGGADQEQFRVEATFDRTETTATIWLGLTMTCARCHTHKYDAIPHAEYYQLFAFFNSGKETNAKLPVSPEATARYLSEKAAYDQKIKTMDGLIASAKVGYEASFEMWKERIREKLSKSNPPAYFDLEDVVATSETRGIEFRVEGKGIVQVSGVNPDGAVRYEVNARLGEIAAPVTGVRIDLLTDKRLPNNGPGRVAHGNFVITEVEVFAGDRPLEFSGATADFSQNKWEASHLVDGNIDEKNGWAIAPQTGKPHHAILKLKSPFTARAGEPLTVRITQNYGQQHSAGRFQVRLMTGEEKEAAVSKEVAKVLALAPDKRNARQQAQLLDYFFKTEYPKTKKLLADREGLRKKAPQEPVMVVRVIAAQSRQTRILERGDFLRPSDVVSANGLSVLPPIVGRKGDTLDRLDLARWLMSETNPLTPRVLANHVWEKLFGEGIVRTMNDFGVRGEPPTHVRLIDWLGAEYRRLGWSRKKLIETIVMSSTYRQASAHREELRKSDPNNLWLARQNRFRVSAEIVRDLCLSASGLLSDKVGGPSVFPPMPPEIATLSYNNNFKWNTSKGEDRYRRGMYTFFKRTSPPPNLLTFDCPDSNTTNVHRRDSNTPIQALTLLNNEVFVEASQAFAGRVLRLRASDDRDRIAQTLRICIGRPPGDREVSRFVNLLETSRAYYRHNSENARELVGAYLPTGLEPAEPAEAAAWVAVTRIVLNLDELITRE